MLKKPSFYLLAVLMLGIVSQVGQVILLRELLVVFHGNELSIGLILASWLLWIGIGSRLGAIFVEQSKYYNILFYLKLTTIALLAILPGTILLIRNLRGFFDILPGAYLSLVDMSISSFLVMAPVCLILGVQFVLLSRIWREQLLAEDTAGAEKTYIGEAAGNMIGGILFTFFMVYHLNSFQSAVLVSMIMMVCVFLMSKKDFLETSSSYNPVSNSGFARTWVVLLVLLIVVVFTFPALERLDDWAYQHQWQNFDLQHQLLDTHQSKHGTIFTARYENQYSFFQDGHLLFSTAGPGVEVPGYEEQDAVDFAHMAMVQHKEPKDVLIIGGGMRGTLNEILKHPVEKIDYVERDEVLTKAAKPYLSQKTLDALDDPRVNMIHEDGRMHVKTSEENKYDVIIVDTPEPVTADLNRYYTREFYWEIKELLQTDGVFVSSAKSTPDLRGTAIANRNTTIYHTLQLVFPHVLPAGEQFMIYFATEDREQVSVDASELGQRYQERNIQASGFSPHRYYTLLEESQLQRVNWLVRNHGRSPGAHIEGPSVVPVFPGSIEQQKQAEEELTHVNERYFVNNDFRPIGYFYSLMFWENLTRDANGQTLKQLLHVEAWWIWPLLIFPLLGVLILRKFSSNKIIERSSYQKLSRSVVPPGTKKPDANFAVLFTIFTTGLSTMTLQIALLFSFQSIYGFVYEMVGLITALFMCGLSLGAQFTHRYVKYKVNVRRLSKIQFLMALLAVLIAVLLPTAAAVQLPTLIFVLFSGLTLAAGFINGIDFPLAAACYMFLNKSADRSAGIVYGMELFGACLGAILASAVLAPVLGIIACCVLAAIVSGTAALVLLLVKNKGNKEENLYEKKEFI